MLFWITSIDEDLWRNLLTPLPLSPWPSPSRLHHLLQTLFGNLFESEHAQNFVHLSLLRERPILLLGSLRGYERRAVSLDGDSFVESSVAINEGPGSDKGRGVDAVGADDFGRLIFRAQQFVDDIRVQDIKINPTSSIGFEATTD